MTTKVVNLKHGEKYDVYIGRAGHGEDGYFGNPYRRRPNESREDCIARFAVYFLARVKRDAEFRQRVLALRGKTLGCFCAPWPCHGNVIAAWVDDPANSPPPPPPPQTDLFS